jgi:alkanesulfonate monooxygenase SsuD/methylene tetrahydromethanopterin reductase-like flavin-dependent oxidoreductase (luciferase family)
MTGSLAVEIGLYTFGDMSPDPATGETIGVAQRYREILAAADLADQAGLAVFAFGEHHRLDIAISSPAVMMAAVAARTRRIRVGSAVTILSTLDPVRVFEDFATVDLVSGGRAEMIAGRGTFIESFPLFGVDLDDYAAVFEEKLGLLLALRDAERVTWQGRFRSPLDNAEISPRPVQDPLPISIGTGGNAENAASAARMGLPLTLANITLPPASLAPQVRDYQRIGAEAGFGPDRIRTCLAGHMHIGETSQGARDAFYPYYSRYFLLHAPKASYAREIPREEYETRAAPDGPLFVGSPQEIVDKILWEKELFGHQRYLAQIDLGGLPFAKVARTIELLEAKVLPALRG